MAEEIRNTQTETNEGNPDTGMVENAEQATLETPEDNNPTIEELMAQLAQEKAARAKDKAALDKALKEKGELTKNLRARSTQQQMEEDAKREEAEAKEAYIKELEAYKHKNEAKERYLLQGMTAELATKAADAEVSGDMDALADIQRQHTEALLKAKEKEWKASRPPLNAGDASSGMSKDEILAIADTEARVKAMAQNIELFK